MLATVEVKAVVMAVVTLAKSESSITYLIGFNFCVSSRKRPADQGPPGQQQDGEKPFKKRWRGMKFYFEKYRW